MLRISLIFNIYDNLSHWLSLDWILSKAQNIGFDDNIEAGRKGMHVVPSSPVFWNCLATQDMMMFRELLKLSNVNLTGL